MYYTQEEKRQNRMELILKFFIVNRIAENNILFQELPLNAPSM